MKLSYRKFLKFSPGALNVGKMLVEILIISLLSGSTTLIGVLLAMKFKQKTTHLVFGIGISSGVMITISFFELLPAAFALVDGLFVILALIAGLLIIMVLDFLLPHMHFVKEKGKLGKIVKISYLVAIGIIIHDFPEGFAMVSSYSAAPALGITVAIGIAFHNIPEEFALSFPLLLAKKKKSLIILAIVSALAEPLGAVLGLVLISIAPNLNPILMAFAAGAMIYVTIDELVPLAQKYERPAIFASGFLVGMITYLILTTIISCNNLVVII